MSDPECAADGPLTHHSRELTPCVRYAVKVAPPPRDLGFDTWFLNLLGIIWAAPAAGKTLSPPPICRKTRRYLTSSHRAAYGSGTSGGGADRDLESYILWVWAAPGAPTTLPRGAKPPRFLARFSVPLAQTHEILDLRSFSGPPPLVPPPCATV